MHRLLSRRGKADAPPAILEAFQACRKSLRGCVDIPALMHHEWAENHLADFNLWGAGIGASADGRASLDSRLALKPSARDVIVNLLRIFKTLIEECHDLCLSGAPHLEENPRGRTDALEIARPPPRSFSPWSDESGSDSQSEADVEFFASNPALSEAMKNTEEILDQLIRIAVTIRRSGTRARLQKADQLFRDDDHSDLRSHLNVVVLSHPPFSEDQIDPRKLTKVQQRLINCNLKRRNRLIYAQKHSKRLNPDLMNSAFAIDLGGDLKPSDSELDQVKDPAREESSEAQVLTDTSPSKPSVGPGGTVTTATVVSSTLTIRPGAVPSQAATTQVSSTGSRLTYPNPPRIKEGARVFKCPCCCQTLPTMMSEGGRWRKHIVGDLSPYTCVLDDCPKPEILYTTKDAWKKHLIEEHQSAQYWVCFACGEAEQFLDEEAFMSHTKERHHETVSEDQIQILTTVCRRSIPLEISACPLCNFSAAEGGEVGRDVVIDHIAEHVHSFSLRALPWAPNDEDTNEQLINYSVRRVREWTAGLEGPQEDAETYPVLDKPRQPRDHANYFETNEYFGDSSGRDTLSQISGDSSKERDLEGLRGEGPLIYPGTPEVGESIDVESNEDKAAYYKNIRAQAERPHLGPSSYYPEMPELEFNKSAFDGANHSLNWISSHRPYENLPVDEELTSKAVPPPSISHFPKLKDPGPNVPLSHEDKGEVIERARLQVLKSTDSEMQLAWAEDALYWVEIAAAAAARLQEVPTGDVRPTTPYIEHTIKVDAMNIVSFLAEQYHPKADFMKSMWLESGKFGYRIDRREAFRGFRRSAEKGYSRSEYRMGMQYESANETTKAIEHYGKGLTMGDSAAQHRLGMMYLLGQHGIILQDYQMGIDMIRSAADTADQNAPQGAYVLGMLLAGELPNIDIPEQYLPVEPLPAKLFVEKAAYLGFAKAELRMGQAYEFGQLGCEFDPALSLHYYGLASWQGEAEADMAISKWFLCGYDDVVEKNEELAFIYAKRAAAANVPTALFAMGYFYETGIHVLTDLREAHDWYQKAVDAGAEDAVKHLDAVLREIGRISLIGR